MPDVICNNDQCSQAFHHVCLFEVWSDAYFNNDYDHLHVGICC